MSCNAATGEERRTGCSANLGHTGGALCRLQLQGSGRDGGAVGCGDEGWSEKGGKDSQREVVRDRVAGVVRRWLASWASGDLSLSGSEGNSQAGAGRWGRPGRRLLGGVWVPWWIWHMWPCLL